MYLIFYTISISKDNEAARRRHRRRICKYVEDDDDEANKVSQRKRNGMIGREDKNESSGHYGKSAGRR